MTAPEIAEGHAQTEQQTPSIWDVIICL